MGIWWWRSKDWNLQMMMMMCILLESDRRIITQLQGKKTSNMMQLSNWRKLWQISIIIYDPEFKTISFLSLLDEIEAALDDSNVCKDLQCCINTKGYTVYIDHTRERRGTMMMAADILYGIDAGEKELLFLNSGFCKFDRRMI